MFPVVGYAKVIKYSFSQLYCEPKIELELFFPDGYSAEELGNFLREVVTLMRSGTHINVISLVATIVLDTLEGAVRQILNDYL